MDLPPFLFDTAQTDILQHDFPYTAGHYHVVQQSYAPWGLDEAFTFPDLYSADLSATPQLYASDSYSLSEALPNHEDLDMESAANIQSTIAALATPTSSMGPPAQPRKSKAPTLRADTWEPHKSRILELHITQKLPLTEVKKRMKEEHGFDAEVRQYRTRISQWKQDKNVKPHEMQAIVRKRQRRKLVETHKPGLIFELRGSEVQPQKIERWMKRHDVAESFLYSPKSAASTPSALGCHTISERGSPALSTIHSPALSSVRSPAVLMSMQDIVNSNAQAPQISSPALSVSSLVQAQGSNFTGQSPALAYRSLSVHYPSSSRYISNTFNEEQRLREHISMAQMTGTDPLVKLSNLFDLGWVFINQGRFKKAEDVARSLLIECRKRQSGDGDDDAHTLKALELFGHVLGSQGTYAKAERIFRHVMREREKLLPPEHIDTLVSIGNLGLALHKQGKYGEAEVMHQQALERKERMLGPEHPSTLYSINSLGLVLREQGRYKEAEAKHRQALEGYKKVLGPEDPSTLHSLDSLGSVLRAQGKYEEAETKHQQALQTKEKVLGSEHPHTLGSLNALGVVVENQGRYEEAEALLRQALQGREKVLGPEHPDTYATLCNLASVLERQGKLIEAEETWQRGRRN